jgi:citrate lyase subunit beta/citryl-CoA lyase
MTLADPQGQTRGSARPSGADVRSDLNVKVTTGSSGGVRINLRSKVASMYGESIRAEVRRVLAAFDVEHAEVDIDDQGGLPFVVSARVETAVRRAGAEGGDARPERTVPLRDRTARDRLRRSRLYLPGNQPKLMINAALHAPDAVILDLEDSVHPDEKDAARILVRNALRVVDFGDAERMVRINQLPLGLADLDAVVPESPDLVLIPKVEHADQVRAVARRIADRQAQTQVAGPVWLMPILESALGIENAFSIAQAEESIVALTIGLEDYTADLAVQKTQEGHETLYARMRLVNAARAAGLQAIDSVYGDVEDAAGLWDWAMRSRALGFEGMGCIHPRQVETIHRAFAPSEEEIERALRIVEAFDEARAAGLSVVRLGTKMIDPPVVHRATRLVENARRAGLLKP